MLLLHSLHVGNDHCIAMHNQFTTNSLEVHTQFTRSSHSVNKKFTLSSQEVHI